MSDKTEKLDSALDHTRKAMREIDTAAYILIQEHTLSSPAFNPLEEIYRSLEHAEQKILELVV